MHQAPEKQRQTVPSTESGDLSDWVREAKAGSRRALEQLTLLFHEKIFRMVYFRTRSVMDAEDLTQDIFIKAFNGLHGLKETEKFKSWLFSIAANHVNDFHRKRKFQQVLGMFRVEDTQMAPEKETDTRPDALEEMMKQEFWDHVHRLLKKLSKMERQVFIFRFLDHLSIKEISLVMKKNESTIKTFLYRALKKFRKETSLLNFLKENSA